MTLSRQAAIAAASLLSAIIMMPPAALADNQPGHRGDTADKDKKHSDKDKKHEGSHAKKGAEKKAPSGGGAYTGAASRPGSEHKGGFGHANPPPRKPGAAPSRGTPAANKEHRKPADTKEHSNHTAPKAPPAPPPVINAQPKKRAPTPNANSNDHSHAKDHDRAKDHGRNDAGDRGKHDQRHGDTDRTPPPSGKPAAVNPTHNPASNRGASDHGSGRHDARQNNLPRPPSAADARKRFDKLRGSRTKKVEGNRTFIKEGDRTIVKQNNRYVIQHDERERLRRVNPHARFEKSKNGTNIAVIDRPGNVRIYSETDSDGHLIRRYRRGPDGRDVMIIDNRRRRHGHHRDHDRGPSGKDIATGIGIGVGIAAGAAILNSVLDVPPPRVSIPRDEYIVNYDGASDEDVYDALSAPPVEDLSDHYTLDEIRATATLRDRMRRVDLDDVNFEFGSWEVDPSEYNKLDRVARAMKRVIHRNPNEVFMIEGYTDAVGSQEDNLSLSDRRAESVAEVLSEEFDVPFENLVTQGYGEDYLKINTDQPERQNRRVAVRRITPLLARGDAPPPPR